MPNVVFTKLKKQPTDKTVQAKIFAFIQKLTDDDTSVGLHVEKMVHAADSRARTARVDQDWRAVLYRLEGAGPERTYLYAGTWEHDEAIRRAQTIKLGVNPVNGVVELVETQPLVEPPNSIGATPGGTPGATSSQAPSFLTSAYNYSRSDLTELGFDESTTKRLLAASTEDELIDIAGQLENAWQQTAALGLAVGDSLDKIQSDLALGHEEQVTEELISDDQRVLEALATPASRMQFAFIRDDDELRRVLDEGDFGAWRVFLHPEQERYAHGHWNGPFRLTGGAGTGKTVVLLHRARALALADPQASIVLTTFTRALGEGLGHDLARLDPTVPQVAALGVPGVLVRGVDQLVMAVRERAGDAFFAAAAGVLGYEVGGSWTPRSNEHGWKEAIQTVQPDLPDDVLAPSFFAGEYLQVVLPLRITTRDEYLTARRPGRGAALDRRRRAEVWKVIERFRQEAERDRRLSWAEIAGVAGLWLEQNPDLPGEHVDHLLVDEGQDLTPSQWQFLRALAEPGRDDLFIAEDSHQRIYGQHVVLSRYGIAITGRARRLTLNYRTTAQNLQYALSVLSGSTYEDPEGREEGIQGYRSARRGPAPALHGAPTDHDQLEQVCRIVEGWLAEGADPGSIAVLTRTNDRADAVRTVLHEHGVGIDQAASADALGQAPKVMTMHTAKGMEFSRVILFDVSDGSIPLGWMLKPAAPADRDDIMLRERSLIYVAATRARDALAITWRGSPSSLLNADG